MTGRKLGRDGIAGVVLLILCAVLFAATYRFPRSPFLPLGPEFYPRVILTLLGLLSAALVVLDLRAASLRTTNRTPGKGPLIHGPVLLTYLFFGAYVALMPLIGFRISTALFVTALATALGTRTIRGFLIAVIAGVIVAVLSAGVFESYLRVLLPRGRLR